MELVFATHNQHKFQEVKLALPTHIKILSLTDIGCFDEIAETEKTLEGNAKLKADHITNTYGLNCFADDSGLLVDALNGAPGVFSARYAGPNNSAEDNMGKLLAELQGASNRTAKFKTVIALNLNKDCRFFSGEVAGNITLEKQGDKGFGYDPVFRPVGFQQTFAELPLTVKNEIGHRGKAIQLLVDYLQDYPSK